MQVWRITYLQLLLRVTVQRKVGNSFAALEGNHINQPECDGPGQRPTEVGQCVEQGHVRPAHCWITDASVKTHDGHKHGVYRHLWDRGHVLVVNGNVGGVS